MSAAGGSEPENEPTPEPVDGDNEPDGKAVSETSMSGNPNLAGGRDLGMDGDYGGRQSAGASGEGGGAEDPDPASSTEE